MQRKKKQKEIRKIKKKNILAWHTTLAPRSFTGLLFQLSPLGGRHQLKHSLTAEKP